MRRGHGPRRLRTVPLIHHERDLLEVRSEALEPASVRPASALTWKRKESPWAPLPKCRYQTAPSSTSCCVKDVVAVKPGSSASEGRHPSGGPSAGMAASTTSPGQTRQARVKAERDPDTRGLR